MSREKELAKNTIILAFGKICTQSISFLMLPFYTAVLDTKDYGTFDLLVTYATLLLPLVNWQFDQGLFRFMLEKRGNHTAQSELFSTILISGTLQSGIYAGMFFLIRPLLSIVNAEFLLAYVILHVYTAIFLQFVRGLGDNTKYAIAGFISASSTVVFNVITLAVFKWGLKGLFTATLLSQVFTIIYLISSSKCWRYFSVKSAKYSIFKSVRRYSLPLIPNNLAWWVVNASDRTVISHFIGLAANGIFTVSSKFPSVFISFYNIVNLSWTESVSLHFDDEDRDVFLTDMVTMFFKIFASACFGVVAIMPFIFPIMVNTKYRDGYNQVLILMYAMLFRVLVGLYSCIYIATKQSKKVAYTSGAAAIINLTVDLLFINRVGLYAASLSSLIAFLVMFIIRYAEINRTVHMRIKRSAALSSIIMGAILTGAFYSNSVMIQGIALAVTIGYGIWANADLLRTVLKMVRKGAIG
ncbi:MAG: lipopolysaccharide biosynthesis protein [Enterocloster bolteae]